MKSLNLSNMGRKVSYGASMSSQSGGAGSDKGKDTQHPHQETRYLYRVEITWSTIIKILITVSAIYFSYRLLQVGIILFFAFVLSSAALPIVRAVEKRGINKYIGVALVYTLAVLLFIALALMVVLPFVHELQALNSTLPKFVDGAIENVIEFMEKLPFGSVSRSDLQGQLMNFYEENIRGSLFKTGVSGAKTTLDTLTSVTGILGSLFLSVVLSIYIVLDHDSFLDVLLLRISDQGGRNLVKNLIRDVEAKLGSWLVGQGTLSLIVGSMVWLLLTIMDVPFALPLAVIAAVLESVPNIGPIVAAVPGFIIALISGGYIPALGVTVGYLVIQQIENTFLVPKIMGNVVGVKPIVVMLGILIGLTLGGIVGAILAVPFLVLLKLGYEFYLSLQKLAANL